MYGKIAIILFIAAVLVAAASTAYATSNQKLTSLDQTCAPLNTYKLEDNQVTIHDTVKDKSVVYKQSPTNKQILCTYEYNYAVEYGSLGYLVLALVIAGIIAGVLHFKYDSTSEHDRLTSKRRGGQ